MKYFPIEKKVFVQNRQALARHLPPRSIAVINANDTMPTSADGVRSFIQNTDLFYLTGIDQEETILLLYPDAQEEKHREVLFVLETSEELATWQGPKATKAAAAEISGVETVHWTNAFERTFRPLALNAERIYLNTNEHPRANITVESRDARFLRWCRDRYPLHRYRRLAPIMHQLRAVKSPEEVSLIRRACGISGGAFRRVLGFIRPGVWEYEIEAEIWHEMIRNRSRGPAFEPIVASGPNGCILHYVKNDRMCQDGELVLMDFGAEYANYASDLTRTVPVGGRFTKRQRAVYDAVLRIQRAAIDLLRPGNTLGTYHKEVVSTVEKELVDLGLLGVDEVGKEGADPPPYKKYFMHGTSHHLGLDVHDVGDVRRKFEPGMVFTCEPGIYIKAEDLGIRLENDILVTDGDPVDLTASVPIEVDEIEALMTP